MFQNSLQGAYLGPSGMTSLSFSLFLSYLDLRSSVGAEPLFCLPNETLLSEWDSIDFPDGSAA